MRLVLSLLAALAGATPAMASAPCSDIDPPVVNTGPKRPITSQDLIRLRDIGFSGSADEPISVSPDHRRVAFQMRRADLDHNEYCLAMIVADLDGTGRKRRVDTGGQPIFSKTFYAGKWLDMANGVPQASVPQWSPDGRFIFYRRRDAGITQIWRADTTGGGSAPLTRSAVDIEEFQLAADGRSLIISTYPGFGASKASAATEGLSGYHFDERYFPMQSSRPVALPPLTPVATVIDVATGAQRPATARETLQVTESTTLTSSGVQRDAVTGSDGLRAALVPYDSKRIFLADALRITDTMGKALPCLGDRCTGAFKGMWWAPDGALYFLKRDGWGRSRSSIYRWTSNGPTPQQVLSTDDLVGGCAAAGMQLICTYEKSIVPRQIVAINFRSGRVTTIYDPNPEARSWAFAPVRRLHWRNTFGIETFGDLVLPLTRKTNDKLPLVVTQYSSRGFLRGATGDEVPIQLLARSGFAVLSLQAPRNYGQFLPAQSQDDMERNDTTNFNNRRSISKRRSENRPR